MIEERWRPIEVWLTIQEAPRYAVSSLGRVKNKKTGRILRPAVDSHGYLHIGLFVDGKQWQIDRRVNRLVCMAFHNEGDFNLEVNHIDGDKFNNAIWNLEWATHLENMRHAILNGLMYGRCGPIRVIETGDIFETQEECASFLSIPRSCLWRVLNGNQSHYKGYSFEYVE